LSVRVNEPTNQVIVTDPSGGAIKVVSVGLRGPAGTPDIGNLIVGGGSLQNEITVKSEASRDLLLSANTLSPSANIIIGSNVVPQDNVVYSLGTPDRQWKDIYVSDGTIFIGVNSSISSSSISLNNFTVDPDGTVRIPGVDIQADANAVDTVSIVASDIASNVSIHAITGEPVNLDTTANSNLVAAINEIYSLTGSSDNKTIGDVQIFEANIKSTAGDLTLSAKDLRVQGNLVVEGSTTSVESTVTVVEDPVFTLGGNTPLIVDDGKDRGLEFRYYDSSSQIGYFGWDNSDSVYVFLQNATNDNEQFSGTLSDVKANLFIGDVLATNITVTDEISVVTMNVGTLSANTISADFSGAVTGDVTGNVVSDLVQAGNLSISDATVSSSSDIFISADETIHLQSNVEATIVQTESVSVGNGATLIDTTIASNVSVGERVVSSFPVSSYKFAKLIINTEDLTYGQSQISEVLLTHDNNNVRLTEYALLHTSTNPLVTFNAFIESNNVVLKASTQSSDNLIKITRILN
jgi:hypothetical protein